MAGTQSPFGIDRDVVERVPTIIRPHGHGVWGKPRGGWGGPTRATPHAHAKSPSFAVAGYSPQRVGPTLPNSKRQRSLPCDAGSGTGAAEGSGAFLTTGSSFETEATVGVQNGPKENRAGRGWGVASRSKARHERGKENPEGQRDVFPPAVASPRAGNLRMNQRNRRQMSTAPSFARARGRSSLEGECELAAMYEA